MRRFLCIASLVTAAFVTACGASQATTTVVVPTEGASPAAAGSSPSIARGHGASGPDRDGDGIADSNDRCPNDPEDFDGFQDEDGCPDPDNDGDGVRDVDDRCPNQPGPRGDGCPKSVGTDRDGDGIADAFDKCPDEPEDKDGFQDADGCPDPDNDMDGIPDAKDQCPNEPEDKDGFQDEDGCPDPDNDKDGIPDVKDKCPNEPETFNGYQDEDGCPDRKPKP
jgi:hypothetical protein